MAIAEGLYDFIKESITRGLPRSRIESALLGAGWERDQVREGLARFADVEYPIAVPRPEPDFEARDAFLYLLLFTTLYLSAIHFGELLFRLVDLWIPDAAVTSPDRARLYINQKIRWAISTLIVAFPVFLYLSSLTGREVRANPLKRASKVRRWLTYLTLFLAAAVVIGDVINLLDDVLGGELTLRFALKSLIVALIAGGVFAYYLRDLRRDELEAQP